MTDRSPIAWRVRTRLVPLLARFLFRLDAVRRFLFRTVSQIGVNYRESTLSEGDVGSVQGGDRLPWIETGSHEDNFAPLASMDWQVHVYGEPRRGVSEACDALRLPIHVFAWTPAMGRAGLVRGRCISSGRTGILGWSSLGAIRTNWAATSCATAYRPPSVATRQSGLILPRSAPDRPGLAVPPELRSDRNSLLAAGAVVGRVQVNPEAHGPAQPERQAGQRLADRQALLPDVETGLAFAVNRPI